MSRVVVVGAGAAGAVVAARLSEDATRDVVLIEAGSSEPTLPELLDGGAIPAAVAGHPANWGYDAELRPDAHVTVPRGRLLGGSSAINGGYFVRARPADFAHWAQVGGAEWTYEQALPLLTALENDLDFGREPGHGSDGPMRLRRPTRDSRLTSAFQRAALELGFSLETDKNAIGAKPGVGPIPSNIIDGVRVNVANAYLTPAQHRPNLTVLGNTRVLRVLIEHERTTGVEVISANGDAEVILADEVVLCAGAVATPQLLMLSGIGPRAELEKWGVPLVANLPVGIDFSDHPNVAVSWLPRESVFDKRERFAFPAALNFDSSGAAGLHPQGDLEILLVNKPVGALFNTQADTNTLAGADAEMLLLVALQSPHSCGKLSLQSADPLVSPRIEYRYLEDVDDRARMRVGVRTAAALLRTEAFTPLFAGFGSLDDDTLATDELLDAWILAHLGTAIHLSGTAAMGTVVDGAGRVQGVSGLRVADTSIVPVVPTRGPFNTAVFIGELIARNMRRHAPTKSRSTHA